MPEIAGTLRSAQAPDIQRTLAILPAMVFVHAPDGSLLWLSPRFHEFTGLSLSDTAGRGWISALHHADLEEVRRRWAHSLREGTAFEGEFRMKRADGQHLWFLARIVPDRDERGALRQWVGICTDIDAQKRAERGLKSLKADLEARVESRTAELQEAVQELEGFSYTVAHDLRAPLRAMHGIAQILLEDYHPILDQRARDFLLRIREANRRMDVLVGDLLSYSRLSRQEISLQPMDLGRTVDQVVAEMAADQSDRGAGIRIVRPLAPVFGHPVALPLVIRNLLTNAVKFVAPGVSPHVVVRSETTGDRVRILVEDNGIGIPAEHQERIFRVFERLHPPDQYSGTGIGLAIVRRATERMSGTVGVASTPGVGSRFWIDLRRGI